jgi:hypothetical protein
MTVYLNVSQRSSLHTCSTNTPATRNNITTILNMSTDYKFEGWVGLDKEAAKGNMVWQAYEPKTFQETDIDVRRRSSISS